MDTYSTVCSKEFQVQNIGHEQARYRGCKAGLGIRSFRSNQMSNCERFAQIAQDKWATVSKSLRSLISKERPWATRSGRSWQMSKVSESLRLLTKNERPWANCSGRSPKMSKSVFWANRSFAHFFAKKTSNSLRKPSQIFLTLWSNILVKSKPNSKVRQFSLKFYSSFVVVGWVQNFLNFWDISIRSKVMENF